MNTKMKTRLISLMICIVMLVGLVPTTAFAADTYAVTVTGGTGGGNYSELDKVTITATPPADMGFKQWNGLDGVTFLDGTNKNSATATFRMPAKDVTATAVYGINNVTATATGNIMPVLGNNAETNPTFTYNFPELTTRSNSCWRYSSDGEDFEYAGYVAGTEKFCVGYWRFDLSVDLNGLSICNPCTVTVNGTKWQFVPSVRIEAESPVYYLDAEGNVSVVMFEIDGVTASCPAMPESLSAEDTLPDLAFTPTPSQAVVRGDGTWQKRSGDTWVDVSGAAKAGNTYRYKTIMHIDSSATTHTFTNDVTLKVNSTSWTVDYTTMQDEGTSDVSVMVYSPEITVTGATVNTINVKGITAPVAGAAPVVTGITTDTAGITLATVQWQKSGGVILNSSDKFEAGQTYYLYVRYEVAEGYEVSRDVTVTSDLANSTYEINTMRVNFQYTVPAAPKYTVTVTGGGTVEGKASVTTEAGTRLQLKAPAVSGKRFTGWSGLDGVTFYGDNAKVTDPVLGIIMPAKNFTVTANYQDAVEITTINIKGITKPLAGANPVNFGVTTDTTGLSVKEVIWYFDRTPSTNVPHDYEFQLGDKLYLLVFLDVADGYTFADSLTFTADLEYTAAYRMPTTDTVYLEYTVTEEMPTTYTVSFDANGGTGTMTPVTGVSGEYELPACTFTAPSGKKFKAWSVGGAEKAVGDKITVTADTTVTAVWETVKYTVTVIDGYGSGEYAAGDTVTIVADSPMTGKRFKEWSVSGGKVLRFTESNITSSTAKFFMPGEDVRIVATYEDIPVPVTLDSIEVTTPPTKTAYIAGETFDPAGMVVTATYTDNSTAPVTGYTVTPAGALGEGDTKITVTYTEDGVVKTATLDITVSAKKYSVTADTAVGGKLTASPASGIRAGESVTVKVTPDDGYTVISVKVYDASGRFVCDVVGGSFTMPASNVTVRAEFEKELPNPAKVVFDASVVLNGAELEAGAFSFELSYSGGSIQTIKNPADGKMTFAPIVFTTIGTDVFYVRQIKGSADSVEYDESVYEVTVKVTLDNDNSLVAEVIGDAIVFTNKYIAPEETTEETEVTTAPEETTEEPEVTTAPEETTEEPEVTTAPEQTTEEPEVTTAPEETTEEPEVTTAPEETTEEPEITTAPEETTEEPEITTVPEETQPENPKTSDNSVFIIVALIAITVFGVAFLACRKRED